MDMDAALLRNVQKGLKRLSSEHGGGETIDGVIDAPYTWADAGLSSTAPRIPRDVWGLMIRGWVTTEVGQKCDDIHALLQSRCQSPLEELLFLALLGETARRYIAVSYPGYPRSVNSGCCRPPHLHLPGHVLVCPQHEIGRVHVDLMVQMWDPNPEYDADGKVVGTVWPTAQVLVEIDGHDFHDRTKEQASRDRKRDRELKKLGFNVFRYTGSDVWKDPYGCSKELLDVLTKEVMGA